MTKQYLLGFDVGSSSVKASLVDVSTGLCAASSFYPEQEAEIISLQHGWAEQHPESWWHYAKTALSHVMQQTGASGSDIQAIGISYQMHGLVCVDKELQPLRNSIIWCDSRAVPYGERALQTLGSDFCLSHLLNFPGNFTAAKLSWVRENEPAVYEKIYKVMLPGDYIGMKLSGEPATTISGLSEGIFWDFKENRLSTELLDSMGIEQDKISDIVPTFGLQGRVSNLAAQETGLRAGTPISYRAGDQPNNALSLNVFNPGEIASTAGTSGVVYGVLGNVNYDPRSRVNTFAHVNHTLDQTRLGVLLCINGTGILNAWIRKNVAAGLSYDDMNREAYTVPVGAEGVSIIPFGNGAERVLENRNIGASIHGLDFNRHNRAHLLRAEQEGIAFSFCYGMEVMRQMGMDIQKIHAGRANMFLSSLFRNTLANTSGATIQLMETDGSVGAAKGAGMGCGIYASHEEAFSSLRLLDVIEPDDKQTEATQKAYALWKERLSDINH